MLTSSISEGTGGNGTPSLSIFSTPPHYRHTHPNRQNFNPLIHERESSEEAERIRQEMNTTDPNERLRINEPPKYAVNRAAYAPSPDIRLCSTTLRSRISHGHRSALTTTRLARYCAREEEKEGVRNRQLSDYQCAQRKCNNDNARIRAREKMLSIEVKERLHAVPAKILGGIIGENRETMKPNDEGSEAYCCRLEGCCQEREKCGCVII